MQSASIAPLSSPEITCTTKRYIVQVTPSLVVLNQRVSPMLPDLTSCLGWKLVSELGSDGNKICDGVRGTQEHINVILVYKSLRYLTMRNNTIDTFLLSSFFIYIHKHWFKICVRQKKPCTIRSHTGKKVD